MSYFSKIEEVIGIFSQRKHDHDLGSNRSRNLLFAEASVFFGGHFCGQPEKPARKARFCLNKSPYADQLQGPLKLSQGFRISFLNPFKAIHDLQRPLRVHLASIDHQRLLRPHSVHVQNRTQPKTNDFPFGTIHILHNLFLTNLSSVGGR